MSGTILFQPCNVIGLGHINRLAAIALAVREREPDVKVLFAVPGSGHELLDELALPWLPLPVEHSKYDASWSLWTKSERCEIEEEISREVLRLLAPNVIVFDCFPHKGFAEAALATRIPIALCLREMRDIERYMAFESKLISRVSIFIIPHAPGSFVIPGIPADSCHFVGDIVRPLAAGSTPHAEHPMVVINAGGGGHPSSVAFYNLVIRAFQKLRTDHPTMEGVLIAGPLFCDWKCLELARGIRVIPFDPEISATFRRADLVVCQAGYNTMMDLVSSGAKAVCVPMEREYDDQFQRASKMSRRYPNVSVFRGTDSEELYCAMKARLSTPGTGVQCPEFKGARHAAELLLALQWQQRADAMPCAPH